MQLMVHEVLEKAENAKTKEEKMKILKDNNTLALRDILRGGMDDTIEFNIPPGIPPYKSNLESTGHTPTALLNKTKQFRYFVKGGPGDNMGAPKRERLFINILESIHPKEAELIIMMKDKKIIRTNNTAHYSGVTKKLVQEVFPGLIRE